MLERILYPIAGVDSELMKSVSGKERNKYKTIGGTILFTGTIASLTCGFAVYTLANSIPIAMSIGTLWGSGIILLDKSFVAGIDKKNDSIKKQIFKAIPRLFLSCTLGFIIGQPIAVLVAQSAIKIEIKEQQKLAYKDNLDALKKKNDEEIEPKKIDEENNLKELAKRLCRKGECIGAREAYDLARTEFFSKNGLYEQYQDSQTQIQAIKAKVQIIEDELDALNSGDAAQSSSSHTTDFFYQWGIFNGLLKKNPNILKLDLLISVLFILIETCPLLVKLMSEQGSYDQLISDQEEFIKKKSEVKKGTETQIIEDEYGIIKHKSAEKKKAKETQIDAEIKAQKEIQAEMIKKSKLKLYQLLAEQFEQIVSQASDINHPEVRASLNETFQVILHKTKKQLLNQAELIEISGVEFEEELHRIKKKILAQETEIQVKQEVKKAQLERLEKEELQSLRDNFLNLQEPDTSSSSSSTTSKTQARRNNHHGKKPNQTKHYFASNFIPYQSPQGETGDDSLNGKNTP